MKIKGPLHGEQARGRTGGVTFRMYRGQPQVSTAKLYGCRRPKKIHVFDPREIQGLYQWGNSQRGLTIVAVGETKEVSKAEDLSGNGRHLNAPSAGTRMRLIESSPQAKGYPYLWGVASLDRLRYDGSLATVAQPFEVFLVMNTHEGAVDDACGMALRTSGRQGVIQMEGAGVKIELRMSSHKDFAGDPKEKPMVWDCLFKGALSRLWWNRIEQIGVGNTGAAALNAISIGDTYDGGFPGFHHYYEWMIYKRELSDIERAEANAAMMLKYGLSGT
jgi:hypothetical protein